MQKRMRKKRQQKQQRIHTKHSLLGKGGKKMLASKVKLKPKTAIRYMYKPQQQSRTLVIVKGKNFFK